MVEKFTALSVFHDHKDLAISLNDLIQLDDIRVPYLFENVDFPAYSFMVTMLCDLTLFKYFKCFKSI